MAASPRYVEQIVGRGGVALAAALAALLHAGCAQAQQHPPDPRDTAAVSQEARDLPPAGYGTLRQEEVSIGLRAGPLQVQVVPLDERVIRLLAPDTYGSLHRLSESKRGEIDDAARRNGVRAPSVFLVILFGTQPDTRFTPDLLTITSQNRFFRPLAILPLSPLWSGQQLSQRETATAIYLFDEGIRILDPFTVDYGGVRNDNWEQTLRTLDRERASVLARVAADRKP